MSTQHERDAESGIDYRGARLSDGEVLRFLSVDPLAGKYAGWSPYNYVLGNPVGFVDPDGKSAEPVFDGKQIVVNMHYMFYGTSASQTIATNAATYLQTELNRHPSTAIGPDGNSYPVSFNVTASYEPDLNKVMGAMAGNMGKNYDPALNFARVEDNMQQATNSSQQNLGFNSEGIQEGRSMSVKGGDNSLILSTRHLNSTTWLHEATVHNFVGRGSDSHFRNWSSNPSQSIPSLMVTRQTRGVPSQFLGSDGLLEIGWRQILSNDKPINVLWGKNQKDRVGGSTNTYFDENGGQSIIKQ